MSRPRTTMRKGRSCGLGLLKASATDRSAPRVGLPRITVRRHLERARRKTSPGHCRARWMTARSTTCCSRRWTRRSARQSLPRPPIFMDTLLGVRLPLKGGVREIPSSDRDPGRLLRRLLGAA